MTLFMPLAAPIFAWAYPGSGPPIYAGTSFLALLLSHAGLVAEAVLIATGFGVPVGIAVTRPHGREFRAIAEAVATIGQTVPPAAVLALMVPVVGFGATPTLIALALYSLMPITAGTIAGLDAVAPELLDAANGLGLTPVQRLRLVELPIAWPLILNGLRLASIIAIGTATIGSTVGALTLGTPIIGGLDGDRPGYVVQGAIIVGLLAIVVDELFQAVSKQSFFEKKDQKTSAR